MEKNILYPLRLISFLLQYPDDDFLHGAGEVGKAAREINSREMKQGIDAFLNYLGTHSLIHLQERYTAAFDMNPSTTLNLTYHLYGDGEKRAGVLVRLQQIYEDAGYERTAGELPDFLPMLLEFLSFLPDNGKTGLIWECLGVLEAYIDRLGETAPSYALLIEPVGRMASNRLEQDGKSAARYL